ncbi:MAG: alpha-2-macroglobulin, partial [Lautropia mirabilis]|nr:alpha-2-macroglobulin [Lautropia mirabilis]
MVDAMKFKPSLLLPAHRFPGEDAGPGTAQRGHAWLVAGLMAALLYPSSSEAMMALTGTPEAVTARTADVADATAAVTGTAAGAPAESSAGTAGKSTENAPARPAILSVSPQGEVYRPRQMVVKFDAPAARFGDAGAESPVLLSCSGLPDAGPDASSSPPASPLGSGRWTGPQEWVQDFLAPLPAGVRCQVSTRPDYRTPSGVLLKPSRHAFDTGGPRIDQVRPWEGNTIEEDQVFVLRLDAPATIASLKQHVWCRQPDLGEQVPVRLVEGERRQAILSGLRYASGEQPAG